MDSNSENTARQGMPVPLLVSLAIASTVMAYFLLVTSTAVASSEAVLLEWIASALIIGWLTFRAMHAARYGHGMKVVIGAGVSLAYFLARIVLAMMGGPG